MTRIILGPWLGVFLISLIQLPAQAGEPVAAVLAVTAGTSPAVQPSPQATSIKTEIEFDRVEGKVIYFKTNDGSPAPKALKTQLYELNHLGVLKNNVEGAQPYFLFSARPCDNCLQDIGIYAIKPSGGKIDSFVFPGQILDSKTGKIVLESRAFFGRCLPRQKGEAYVVFQKEIVDRRRGMQSSVFVAEPGSDYMSEKLIERRLPAVRDALHFVKRKTCQEIAGRNRRMLTKPLDLTLRKGETESDDDDEESPKENQSDRDISNSPSQ